jgi:hypothetical protein
VTVSIFFLNFVCFCFYFITISRCVQQIHSGCTTSLDLKKKKKKKIKTKQNKTKPHTNLVSFHIECESMSILVCVVVACVLLAVVGVRGVYVEQGDAGEAIRGAQQADLTSPNDNIIGELRFGADMFSIFVIDASLFSASTVGTDGTLPNTQLFVFDSVGRGIVANDDFGASQRSFITSAQFVANGGAVGVYHIAITAFNLDPQTPTSVPIFDVDGNPVNPNAIVTRFRGSSGAAQVGTYTIALTGVGPFPSEMIGDPHVAGAHGIKFDVFGAPGANYSMLVAPAFEVNMQLAKRGPKLRFMTAMSVLYRGKSFTITPASASKSKSADRGSRALA